MTIGDVISNKVIIEGQELTVQSRKDGKEHRVYYFVPGTALSCGDSSSFVLRTVNPLMNPKKIPSQKKTDELMYQHLLTSAIPVPQRFLFSDKGWVLEKMGSEIDLSKWKAAQNLDELSELDTKILVFVKKILTLNANGLHDPAIKKECVGNFCPGNVMLNRNNEPCVVDFASRLKGVWNLYDSLENWSSGNVVIKQHLSSDFPEAIKDELQAIATRTTQILAAQSAKVPD